MSEKKTIKLYKCLLLSKLTALNSNFIKHKSNIISCSKPFVDKFGNTGKLFKQAAFIGLALSCVNFNKFLILKIKSVMFGLWNTIAAYTVIF